MKKQLAAVVATAALALTAAPVASASAEPVTSAAKGCVTKAEYKRVKNGMTKAAVHKIFGTAGKRVSNGSGVEARAYAVCTSKRGAAAVVYANGKVASKAAQWR